MSSQIDLGIDLGALGVTPISFDLQICSPTLGCAANGEQDFPVLTEAQLPPGPSRPLRVVGRLTSVVRFAPYDIQFFANSRRDASGHAEGEILLAAEDVTITNSGLCLAGNCIASFDFNIQSDCVEPNDYLSATATTPGGYTSEFARCIRILAVDVIFTGDFG